MKMLVRAPGAEARSRPPALSWRRSGPGASGRTRTADARGVWRGKSGSNGTNLVLGVGVRRELAGEALKGTAGLLMPWNLQASTLVLLEWPSMVTPLLPGFARLKRAVEVISLRLAFVSAI